MAIMAFTSGPLAAISAAILVLGESSAITSVLSRSFLIEDALIDTFDGTLVARDQEPLVAQGRQMKPRSGGRDAMARLGKIFTRPLARLNPRALLRSLLYLPLNLIPVVGTVLYIFMQGKRAGPILHARYFQLKGWDSTMREEWVKKNQGAYTGCVNSIFLPTIHSNADCSSDLELRPLFWKWYHLPRSHFHSRILLAQLSGLRIWRRQLSSQLTICSRLNCP